MLRGGIPIAPPPPNKNFFEIVFPCDAKAFKEALLNVVIFSNQGMCMSSPIVEPIVDERRDSCP